MKKSLLKQAGVLALLSFINVAFAANELVVYGYKDGVVAEGLTVKLDGEQEQILRRDGSAYFDLSAGAHSLQILEDDEVLHTLRFNAGKGQLTDIRISLNGETEALVESYFRIESNIDRLNAPRGILAGKVSSLNIPLAGATIKVDGINVSTKTDAEGRYELELPRGIYDLQIRHPEFGDRDITDFRVVSNVARSANFSLGMLEDSIVEVVVLGSYRPTGLELDERSTINVVDTLGLEELARFGDSDVAGAVVRVPSITVQDDRFIFIRGLGGRYITTTLNGATMPSTDPSKRTVPLDLFPSNIVSQLDVKKTAIASMPGESTGGNLVINTRSFPDERAGKFSVSFSGVDGLTGDTVFTDPLSGDFDWLGWDDGTREEPVTVSAIADILNLGTVTDSTNGTTFELPEAAEIELQRLGALLLRDGMDLGQETASPKYSISANYGGLFALGDNDIGVFAAVNYKNGWSQKDEGVSNTFTPSGDPLDVLKFQEYANNIDISGLLSLGLNLGNNTFDANTILSRTTTSKVIRTVGREGDEGQATVRHNIDWIERQFISQQLAGSHFLNEDGSFLMNWQVTASQAKRLAPDRREVLFNADNALTSPVDLLNSYDLDKPGNEQTVALDGFILEANELLRRYDDLTDDNLDLSSDFSYEFFANDESEANLAFGFQLITRERDSDSSSYGFNVKQELIDLVQAPNVLVSDVLTEDSITGDTDTGFAFFDKTLASDSYEAEMDLNSVYVSYDHLFNSKYQVIAGVRYEDYKQVTDTFTLQGEGEQVVSEIDESIALPSLSFNWFYSDMQQLRLAVSQTVSRPDFKETSNATFYDNEFDFRVRGNPNLKVSEVINYDARWEWYYADTESVSVALFYKELEDPIERVVQAASGTAGNSRTFQNADSAEIYGIEIEGRKEFALNSDLTRSIFVTLNASSIESEVMLADGATRKLQGQPDYTFNLIIGYDDLQTNQELTLLFNQSGESIKDVGILGNPDVIEEPRLDVKLNYKYSLSDTLLIKASVDNLLNEDIEFTQGGRVFQGYKKGVEFQLGMDWNF